MALYGYGFLIGMALILIFWFLIVAPMERRMHQRKMDLMQKKLARNEERLRKLKSLKQSKGDNAEDPGQTDRAD